MSKFTKAVKKKARLRLGITGPSGSGKTYSALLLASGLSKKIAVIDTEKGSASLYSNLVDFDVLELAPPYSPERYTEAMIEAVKEGYEVIILDSISHAWAGVGGILNQKEQLDARGGNSFANWAKMTPIQERFIANITNCPAHIIVTMRSKQDHSAITEGGKTKIQKLGLAPIQRDGFEYELTTVFDVAMNHEAEASKDRTGIFVDKIFKITKETGEQLKAWLDSSTLTEPPTKVATPVEPPRNEVAPESPQYQSSFPHNPQSNTQVNNSMPDDYDIPPPPPPEMREQELPMIPPHATRPQAQAGYRPRHPNMAPNAKQPLPVLERLKETKLGHRG